MPTSAAATTPTHVGGMDGVQQAAIEPSKKIPGQEQRIKPRPLPFHCFTPYLPIYPYQNCVDARRGPHLV